MSPEEALKAIRDLTRELRDDSPPGQLQQIVATVHTLARKGLGGHEALGRSPSDCQARPGSLKVYRS